VEFKQQDFSFLVDLLVPPSTYSGATEEYNGSTWTSNPTGSLNNNKINN
jgi:hypothetical protein